MVHHCSKGRLVLPRSVVNGLILSPTSFQVNELLISIKDLRRDKLTRAAVVMDWMTRRIQPLQKQSQFGFHYLGVKDPSRFLSRKSPRVKLCVWFIEYSMEYLASQ